MSRYWAGEDGKRGWLKPDGSCVRIPPAKLGVIGNGHHVKMGRGGEPSVWDQSFERLFDKADSRVPELCERAGVDYPAEAFADQVLAQLAPEGLPAGWKGTAVPAAIAEVVQGHAERQHPLPMELARKLLHALDALVDLGDRRSAALQQSGSFRGVRLATLA